MDWQRMETAPKDGTRIQVKIPGYRAPFAIEWMEGLVDSDGNDCGGWSISEAQEPPENWTDGVCWEVNEDGEQSTLPSGWKPLPESQK